MSFEGKSVQVIHLACIIVGNHKTESRRSNRKIIKLLIKNGEKLASTRKSIKEYMPKVIENVLSKDRRTVKLGRSTNRTQQLYEQPWSDI